MENKKVLLMGPASSGKTSMRSIIFANFVARDTQKFTSTISVERSTVRFLGNLNLSLWDCGAQIKFMNSYFTTERQNIFSNVSVLIFVLDVKSNRVDDDLADYEKCVQSLLEYSKDAKLFCLVHKMDLIPKDDREKIFQGISNAMMKISKPFSLNCFQTSIWEETLYKAWSSIVYSLIPNADLIERHISEFMNVIEAEEVIIFEKATFLDIARTTNRRSVKYYKDNHRFERISNIIKMFKLSCMKTGAQLKSMAVHNTNFDAFLDEFTTNTYIIVITSDPTVKTAATILNIKNARGHFESLLNLSAIN